MQLAKVVGTVVATVKDPGLEGRTLLVIQPIGPSGVGTGAPLVAIDGVGVGVGEEVLFVRGREAAFAFLPDTVVADVSIVGKVDAINVGGEGSGARRAPSSPREERGERASRSPQLGAAGVGPRRTDRRGERALKK